MALPVVKKEDKTSTKKAAESDLSPAAPILNKLLDTMRGRDQKENRFLSKHIDGESTEYTSIQDNNLNMINILNSQSETERLLGSMKDITNTDTVRTSSPVQILRPARQEIKEKQQQISRPVATASISASSAIGKDVPKIVTESVKKIDSYVSTQQSDSKFSELRTINEETSEALQRSSGLLSNIDQNIQKHNQLLEEINNNLKNQAQQEDNTDELPDINIDLDFGRRNRNRGSQRGTNRPQRRGSVPEVRQTPRPAATPETPRAARSRGLTSSRFAAAGLGVVFTAIEGLQLISELDQIEYEYSINEIDSNTYKQRYGAAFGSFFGSAAGAAALGTVGAALGAPIAGVGALVFGIIGGVAGAFAGSEVGSWMGATIAAALMGESPPRPPNPRDMTVKDQEDIQKLLKDNNFRQSLDPKIIEILEIISDKDQIDLTNRTQARGAKNILNDLIRENEEAFKKARERRGQTSTPDASQVSATPASANVTPVPATPDAIPVPQANTEQNDAEKILNNAAQRHQTAIKEQENINRERITFKEKFGEPDTEETIRPEPNSNIRFSPYQVQVYSNPEAQNQYKDLNKREHAAEKQRDVAFRDAAKEIADLKPEKPGDVNRSSIRMQNSWSMIQALTTRYGYTSEQLQKYNGGPTEQNFIMINGIRYSPAIRQLFDQELNKELSKRASTSETLTPVPQVNTTSVSATPQAIPVSITSTPVPQAGLTLQATPASANVTPVSSNVIPQQDYSSFVSASSTAMNVIQFLQQNQTASVSTPSPARPSVSSIISQPASQQTASQIITPSDSNTIEEKIKKTLSEYNDLLIKLDENDKLSDKIASKKITTERQISFEKRRSADTQTSNILAKLESDLKYYETIDQKRKILQKNIIEEYSSARDEYSNVRRILNNARGVSTNDIQKQAEEVFSKRNQTDETKLKEFNKQYSNLEKELEKEPPKDFAIIDTTGENAGITPIPSITETPVISPVPSTPVSAQLLAASTPSVNKEYVVKRGDTLSGIAKSNNLKLEDILKANPQIKNPNDIKLGQTIKIADASNVNDKFNKILSKYKEFFDKINSNSKLNDDISKKVVHYETNIRNEKRKNDAVSNQIITKLEFNLKYYNTLNIKRIELEKRVNDSYTRAIDEYSNIRRMLQTIETYRENDKKEANKEIESKFKEQEKIDLDNLKQFESEYENLIKLLNSEPKEIETTAQPERRGDDVTSVVAAPVNDAEPLDKDLLSPVSQTYMEDTTDTGFWQEAESTDTGWQEAGSEPTSRPMARPTRTRRQSSGDTSDSLTITARDVVFKSDKMEAPFLDAIKEELSDFMNTIMNVSGQGAAVTPNLAGGSMGSTGGLASPVSFANVSGGMRPPTMPSFGSGSDTSTQQGQDQSQSQGGTSEKPENVTIDSGVDISKVDKDLLGGFYAAAKEYGKPVKINSGFRSDEKQAELFVRANVFKEPGIYMPAKPDKDTTINYRGQTFNVPGGRTKSSHGGSSSSARALDVSRNALEEMDSMGLLRKYGLHRPFPNDPVHVERIGGRSAPPDTSTDGAQQASQVSATPVTATASGGESTDGGGETATPVASTTSGGGEMTPGGGDQPASMTPSTPSSGPTVATASVDNEVAKRTPMTPSAPTPDVPSSGTSSPGVGDTSYPISMGNPGNVEPPDAAQRYALLFDMAA